MLQLEPAVLLQVDKERVLDAYDCERKDWEESMAPDDKLTRCCRWKERSERRLVVD